MKKVFFITLLFIFQLSYAQTSSIKGRVLDSAGFPLPGATIQAQPSGKAVVSDFNEFFTITYGKNDIRFEKKLLFSPEIFHSGTGTLHILFHPFCTG